MREGGGGRGVREGEEVTASICSTSFLIAALQVGTGGLDGGTEVSDRILLSTSETACEALQLLVRYFGCL